MSIFEEYAASLSELSGIAFQAEVCAHLHQSILGFQTIPSKPHGDAGLDGFSHNGKRGYCCYGLETIPPPTDSKREKAIIKKFKSDLRRLFELDSKNKKLFDAESPEMAKILPTGIKLEYVELIANWYESHRVLNPIHDAINEYKAASKCRYIESTVKVVILGPKELANLYAVDEFTIARAQQRCFIDAVKQKAKGVAIENPKDFESKMTILRKLNPGQDDAISILAESFMTQWKMAIAFDKKLDETAPSLHQTFEEDRLKILTKVLSLMVGADRPWQKLPEAEKIAEEILNASLGRQFGGLVADVSLGEIARLIGECPINWKEPVN